MRSGFQGGLRFCALRSFPTSARGAAAPKFAHKIKTYNAVRTSLLIRSDVAIIRALRAQNGLIATWLPLHARL